MKFVLVFLFFLKTLSTYAQLANVNVLINAINIDSMMLTVKQLSGELPVKTTQGDYYIVSRYKGSEGNKVTRALIKSKLSRWGVPYDTLNFNTTGQNIIAKIEGRKTNKVVMVGAHFDAVGVANPVPTFIHPGADDNASGTAAVLEFIRVCALHQFPVTIHFAFWDEEEQNLTGSRAHAPIYANNLIAYINHDMIGWTANNDSIVEIHTRASGYSVDLANKVVAINQLYQIALKPVIINPGVSATDHGSFWDNGLTAVGINEIYNGPLSNPHWHKVSDSSGTLNPTYFLQISKLGLATALHIANDSLNYLGVQNNNYKKNIYVQTYPNPFKTRFNLDSENGNTKLIYKLTNQFGTTLKEGKVEKNQQIEVAANAGIFFLFIYHEKQLVHKEKLIKVD